MAKSKVRYKGIADERRISAKDLKDRDIVVEKDLVWNRGNLFALNIDLTPELEALLRNEGHFRIEALDDAGATAEIVAEPTDAENPGDTIVDGDTGAKTKGRK